MHNGVPLGFGYIINGGDVAARLRKLEIAMPRGVFGTASEEGPHSDIEG